MEEYIIYLRDYTLPDHNCFIYRRNSGRRQKSLSEQKLTSGWSSEESLEGQSLASLLLMTYLTLAVTTVQPSMIDILFCSRQINWFYDIEI